jgi:DNA mismatch repair protein MutH
LVDVESLAIIDHVEVTARGFERTIIGRFSRFIGLTTDEIEAILGIELNASAKGYRATLARRVMGVSTKNVEEFDRAGISMKTILVDEKGRPPESMSFPVFRYMGPGSILEQEWESDEEDEIPQIKRILEDTRFLFVVFQRFAGTIRLKEVKFWSMTSSDIETYVKPVWQETRKSIELGNLPDLPKGSFNSVCHVRPHAANKRDTLPTPFNGEQVKKCFWLDRRYIQRQVASGEQLALT